MGHGHLATGLANVFILLNTEPYTEASAESGYSQGTVLDKARRVGARKLVQFFSCLSNPYLQIKGCQKSLIKIITIFLLTIPFDLISLKFQTIITCSFSQALGFVFVI